ncbi:MAG: restriction endonuclease [Candidatus Gracilibacteria bacterium]
MKQLITPETLKVGEVYSNDQLQYALSIGNSGGIRPKLYDNKLDFIVLITSAEENKNIIQNPYADEIEGDILTYTGTGLAGDQVLSGPNKRLIEQNEKAIPILGFLKEGTNQYRFMGFLFLLRHYQDYQIDNNNKLRKVWLFEFQILPDVSVVKIGDFNGTFVPLYENFKKEISQDDLKIDEVQTQLIIDEGVLIDIESLRKNLLTINPYDFENLIANLIAHTGFLDVKVTKKSGDDGVDVNALLKHTFSFDLNYQFQVKRWKHSVGRKEVANLRGSLSFNNFGVIISTSHFTSSAIKEAQGSGKIPIHLIGMKELHEIIKETNFTIK